MLRIFFIFIIFFTSPILANTFSIDMLNVRSDGQSMVYSEDVLKVEVGDTVVWKPKDKGHNVEFIIGPDAIELPKKSRINQEFTYTFEKPGLYFYQCTPHKSMGMIGFIVVGNNKSNLDDIKKIKFVAKSKKIAPDLINSL